MKICSVLLILLLLYSCTSKQTTNSSQISIQQDTGIISLMRLVDDSIPDLYLGDWLSIHHEENQTLPKYMYSQPIRKKNVTDKIYILPIGTFNSQEKYIIKVAIEFVQLFYQTETILLDPYKPEIPDSFVRFGYELEQNQYKTTYFHNLLKKKFPEDVFIFMGITNLDLFTNENNNYVFGQATLYSRVGITSLKRLNINPEDTVLSLKRVCKTLCHELGHTLTIQHCIYASCMMNGSNHISEADRRPCRMCSQCTSKLVYNLKFDQKKRLEEMLSFYEKYNFKDDALKTEKLLSIIHATLN